LTEEVAQAFSWWADLVKPFFIPALGAIVGVLIKDWFDHRKTRKQYGVTDAEFLCTQINEIREFALSYWAESLKKENQHLLEARIIGMLHGCAEIIATTNLGNGDDREKLQEALTEFRKACTSGSFGQAERDFSRQRLNEVEIEGRALVAKVLSFRRK
jgi:hypothetical protein